MQMDMEKHQKTDVAKRWKGYLAKAAILVVVLFLFGRVAGVLPSVAIYVIWAALTTFSAIGAEYRVVIRKALKQFKYKTGGNFSRINNGRMISFPVCFVISALFVASLLIEVPKWDVFEWALIIVAVPLFIAIYGFWEKHADDEIEPPFERESIIRFSYVTLAILLAMLYFVFLYFAPSGSYGSVGEAIQACSHPFEQSQSTLIEVIGKAASVSDGFAVFGVSIASNFFIWVSIAFKVFVCVTAFFGISNMYGTCSLGTREIKNVFQPIDALKNPEGEYKIQKRFVAIAALLPLFLIAGPVAADAKVEELSKTDEYQYLAEYVDEQIEVVAYVIDGRYFDKRHVDKLIETTKEDLDKVTQQYKDQMAPLVNEVFDKRVANVDSYLDWYYRPTGDYELLLEFITQLSGKAVEDAMRQQFEEKINENVDSGELDALYESYKDDIEGIKATFDEELEKYRLDDAEKTRVTTEVPIDFDFLDEPFEVPRQQIDGTTRLLASAGIGTLGAKVIAKPFFKKMAAKLATSLAAKGLAAGGVVSVNAPAIIAGLVFTVITDFLVLKADEALNRESYKQEIIDSIEEDRFTALEALQGT